MAVKPVRDQCRLRVPCQNNVTKVKVKNTQGKSKPNVKLIRGSPCL